MTLDELRNTVLQKIAPSKTEKNKLNKVIDELYKKIDKLKPENTKTMIVGSVAKDTYLKNSFDIDFFVLFPETYKREELADIVLSIGKKILTNWMIQYAEHPYIQGFYQGHNVDIVPCYQVKNPLQKLSAVDRTPFHTEFIRQCLDESMKDEVRLLKQFLKGIGCYGAETRVEGFSGYLTELLILKYGTFNDVLKESQHWKENSVLFLNNFSGDKQSIEFKFIDPVDSTRNVAAALSNEQLSKFIYAASKFLENPKIEFFFPNKAKQLSKVELNNHLQNFIGICFKKPKIADDTLYPQLKKAAGNIATLMELYDFTVLRKAWNANGYAFVAVELESLNLEKEKLHMGPPLLNENHAKKFIEKWAHHKRTIKPPFKKEGRLWTIINREYTDAPSVLNAHLNELSIGKNVRKEKKTLHICTFSELATYIDYWNEYFSKDDTWNR